MDLERVAKIVLALEIRDEVGLWRSAYLAE